VILSFGDVLTIDEHRALRARLDGATFVDGRQTAGAALASLKHNEQLAPDSSTLAGVVEIVLAALRRHAPFCDALLPRQLHSLMVARYRPGMQYGAHVDAALMGSERVHRSDASLTLFLNEPTDYDGGELSLDTGSGDMRIKLPARALVCYPTGQTHQVLPVTRGERLVVVAWIESFVRDTTARSILWDLAQARDEIFAKEGKSRAFDLVVRAHANLLRQVAGT